MGLGLARSSIFKSMGSSNTDLRASVLTCDQRLCEEGCTMIIINEKMEIHGRIGSPCFKYGDKSGVGS